MNVALTAAPEHIPAYLLRDIDPWQLLLSAGPASDSSSSR
jgi:hypothetical protein